MVETADVPLQTRLVDAVVREGDLVERTTLWKGGEEVSPPISVGILFTATEVPLANA